MNHIYGLSNIHLLQPCVVTIGVFDGVHKGHQYLIRQLVDEARATGRLAVVMTFFPHPDVVLRGITGRHYLTTPEQRAEYLLELGVDYVITHPFDEETRQIRAADFVDLLKRYLRLERLWVGEDFALGYKREGNIEFLEQQGEQKDFTLHVVKMVEADNNGRISSTRIRQGLENGEVEQVREWLGRGYAVSGEVVHGQKRGRTIGFPTANLNVWEQQMIPANGVYAGWAMLGDERFMAMTNVGVSPQFEYKGVTVEAYLLDFDRDIYGEILTITFEKYIRPEAKFDSLQGLVDQINADVVMGRAYLSSLVAE